MEKIVMPELITPAFADIMASRPEVLEQLLGCMGENEEVAVKSSVELDKEDLAKVLKLLFCNVNINIINTGSNVEEEPFCSMRNKVEELKGLEEKLDEIRKKLDAIRDEVDSLGKKVLVTETMVRDYEKVLKLFGKIPGSRKLTYKYKLEINGMQKGLKKEKAFLEEKMQLLEHTQCEKTQLEERIRKSISSLVYHPE